MHTVDNGNLASLERRIRIEYTEWPRLALTLAQARRLWDIPDDLCETVFSALVLTGFLERVDGRFCRTRAGATSRGAGADEPYGGRQIA
jgi:hypothetical protein